MLKKLQQKWGVTPWQLVLILCTFAIGGSLSGFLAKKVMGIVPLEKSMLTLVLYIVVVTILWPFCVLAISILFGQFNFFKSYLKKLAKKIKLIS